MKYNVVFLIFFFYSNTIIGQTCDLTSLFGQNAEIEIIGKKIEIGKSVDSHIKKVGKLTLSGTSYLISFDSCKYYLPVVEGFNDKRFELGGEYSFVISFVYLENGVRYYFIKEIKLKL